MDRNKPVTTRHGVIINCPPEDIDINVGILESWFTGRDDVHIIDSGKSDKKGEGIIVMRFDEGLPEHWFIQKLEEDATIYDYTVYEDE